MAGDDSTSQDIRYPTEYMQQLAKTRQTRWPDEATTGRNKIKDNTLALEDFGKLEPFKVFGQVYMAARTVYLDTLDGVRQDLEAAADGIVTSAKQMNDRDDQAGAAFLTLKQRWESGLANEHSQTSASQTKEVQQATQAQQAVAKDQPPAPSGGPAATSAAAAPAPATTSPQNEGLSTPTIQ